MEIKNSIFDRLTDVVRRDGPDSYMTAIKGEDGGVDLSSTSMSAYIGSVILPELLVMKKVGVFIDREPMPEKRTKADDKKSRPYLYVFRAEEILSWAFDNKNRLKTLMLKVTNDETDSETGLIIGTTEGYRLFIRTDAGIEVTNYNVDGNAQEQKSFLELKEIPFVIFEMNESLMIDIADYQIALLNIASSDLGYILKANFPFYTEQVGGLGVIGQQGREELDADGKVIVNTEAKKTVDVGATNGRQYAKGAERPGFIHPSSEPLKASMDKQNQLKDEIRQLVQLSLANITQQRQSTESKVQDQQGLEAGLSNIGLELEAGERRIAEIWAEYTGDKPAIVNYPTKYSLKSDEERRAEADALVKTVSGIPSATYRREVLKKACMNYLGNRLTPEIEAAITSELQKVDVLVVDPATIVASVEAGLLDNDAGATALGYPAGSAAKAATDHAERLARIAAAQSKPGEAGTIKDNQGQPNQDNKESKNTSQDPTLNKDAGVPKTRGKE